MNAQPQQPLTVTAIEDELPSELSRQRELIKSAVDVAASGVIDNIRRLRKEIDELENLVIQNGARVTENLNTHVGICEAAQIEVSRLRSIVTEMRKTQIDDVNEPKGRTNGAGSSVL
jgi:hypothetical protein